MSKKTIFTSHPAENDDKPKEDDKAKKLQAYPEFDENVQNKNSINAILVTIISFMLIIFVIVAIEIHIYSGRNSGSSALNYEADKTQIEQEVQSQTPAQLADKNQSKDIWQEGGKASSHDWKVGDEVTFGRYNNEELYWRVLKKNDDGTYMLVASQLISVKAFDAAESGEAYTYEGETYIGLNKPDVSMQAYVTGDNSWDTSNIRTWLNSDEEVVNYEDTPPVSKAMSDGKNAYNVESGFLHGFTKEERDLIVEVENITRGNILRDYEDVTTKDRVYLLSEKEISLFDEAGISKYAKLTDTAESLDQAQWKNIYQELMNTDYGIYWLRDCVDASATKVKVMANGNVGVDIIEVYSACCDGIGIRPVINVR